MKVLDKFNNSVRPELAIPTDSATAKIASMWTDIPGLKNPFMLMTHDYKRIRQERSGAILEMMDWEASGVDDNFRLRKDRLLHREDSLILVEAAVELYPTQGWACEFITELLTRELAAEIKRAEVAIDTKAQDDHRKNAENLRTRIRETQAEKPEQVKDFIEAWGLRNRIRGNRGFDRRFWGR